MSECLDYMCYYELRVICMFLFQSLSPVVQTVIGVKTVERKEPHHITRGAVNQHEIK